MRSRSSDRPPVEDQATSGAQVAMEVVDAVMTRRELAGYRVVYRMSPRGEHVVTVIWPQPS